ncbi:MAG: cold shock domain-containing protein [Roseburia sp.]|nr:cold shock domain-containing protein [Roseburia sp.]
MEIKGKVKWFDSRKGFGFIRTEDGQEIFVHQQDIKEGRPVTFQELRTGDEVTMQIEEADKGPKAVGVKMVSHSAEAKSE